MAFTPDANIVSIRNLQPEKAFVRVSGRTVRTSDVKAFTDKRDGNKQRWIQSFTIKDNMDTIEVKLWHKSPEHVDSYSHISLDQVVHVFTDDVKLNLKPSSRGQASNIAPISSSSLCLNLSEGKLGHKIVLGDEREMATLFKTALNSNMSGVVPSVSIKQIMGTLNTSKNKCFNLVVCVKKLVSSNMISTKRGPAIKTLLTVFDAQGQESSLTLWGESMACTAKQWVPFVTSLILTAPQIGVYASKLQISVGYQTLIQVDPQCKNVEWLKHSVTQCSMDKLNTGTDGDALDIPLDHIRSSYRIVDIMRLAEGLEPTGIAFGFTYAVLTELDIDNCASEVLSAIW
ncbi:hypothetical protein EDD11_008449 [Mortierella claussenii]|nr:hypothetical protein EDD11_008449 [Mortierella claussenii]